MTPRVDRSSKPVSLLGGDSGALRTVRVPLPLVKDFMSLAAGNTAKNIETCGVLAGIMVKANSLLYRHLISGN